VDRWYRRNLGSDDLSYVPRAGVAADVGRANIGMGQHLENGLLDRVSGLHFAEVFQHHRARPDLGHGICDPPSRDVGSGTMNRLKQ
jgi:hypothetical protein